MSSFAERMAKKAKRPMNRAQRRAHKQAQERDKMQIGSRIRRRVQKRLQIEGADWLKQMRRSQRNQPGVIKGSPELKARLLMKNELDLDGEQKRYADLPTPEQLEEEERRVTEPIDQRASRKR